MSHFKTCLIRIYLSIFKKNDKTTPYKISEIIYICDEQLFSLWLAKKDKYED
jgi:hypothetical protein